MFLASGSAGFLCWKLDHGPLPHLGDWNCLRVTSIYFLLLVVVGAAGRDEPTSVAKRGGLCFKAVLTANLAALSFLQDVTDFDQSIDEEHSGEGARVIACHSNNTSQLRRKIQPMVLLHKLLLSLPQLIPTSKILMLTLNSVSLFNMVKS